MKLIMMVRADSKEGAERRRTKEAVDLGQN